MNLTPKQLNILTKIRDIRITRGYSPSLQELADAMGVSKVTIFEHVEALIKKGALQRKPNKARSLELSQDLKLPDEERHSRIPLVGTIAAGSPIEAVENRESLDLESLFTGPGQTSYSDDFKSDGPGTFALRVRGDSMIEAHIQENDYAIIRRQNTARNGQIVVALLPETGEATLKYYFKEKDHVRLQPANAKYEPIIVPANVVCTIQGVLVGVVRAY
jgi:repressor LexA